MNELLETQKTWWVLILKFQTRLNSSSTVCIFEKLKLDGTWNTWNIQAKTLKIYLKTQAQTRKINFHWIWYVFKLEVFKLNAPQIQWNVCSSTTFNRVKIEARHLRKMNKKLTFSIMCTKEKSFEQSYLLGWRSLKFSTPNKTCWKIIIFEIVFVHFHHGF